MYLQIYASQGYKDVDLKIRNRTEQYYYIDNFFLDFSRVRRIDFFFDIINYNITEGFSFAPAITDFFFWRPHYYDNIDSYELINGSYNEQPELILWNTKQEVSVKS